MIDFEIDMNTSDKINLDIKEEIYQVHEDDYEKLRNLPSLDGKKMVCNIN